MAILPRLFPGALTGRCECQWDSEQSALHGCRGHCQAQSHIVRALTMQAYSEREDARRMKEPYDPCWLPATVLVPVLDPVTQRIDGFHIRQPNWEEPMSARPDVIQVDDYVRIVQMALEGPMPVFPPVPSAPRRVRPEEYAHRTPGAGVYDHVALECIKGKKGVAF